jgi:hypothetical protein
MWTEINITGGSYTHKARALSSQQTLNFWPQVQNGAGTSDYILESWPGLTSFSAGSGTDRGMIEHKGTLYKVTGTTLASIASTGTRTTLGTIPGTGRCVFDAIADTIIIVTDGVPYTWDGATLTTGTDIDFETPYTVTVLNNQAIYDGDDSRFCVSDVGAPLTINALNYASAEAVADNLVRPYAFNQVVQMFGEKHIEGWWNSGSGSPPFDRLEGGLFQIGLSARYSVANNKNAIYFLGSDRNVYRLGQAGPAADFTPFPLVREFNGYTTVSDAIGWCMSYQGQEFYILKFPTENKTFAYPEGGQWFQLSSRDYDDYAIAGRYRGNSYAFCYGRHLIADEDGNVLELSDTTYTDNGDPIRRVRDSAPIHSGLLGKAGKPIFLYSFKLILETGTGAEAAEIMLSLSTDGGKTFGSEFVSDLGIRGDYLKTVEWKGLNACGESIVVRISTSDGYYYSLHSAAAELGVGI